MANDTRVEHILSREKVFHDQWADTIDVNEIMVDEFFEASTSPENRIISKKLGNIKDKKILELGCGAGEASVYFAKKGADVLATDISAGMLRIVQELAKRHHVSVSTKLVVSHNIDVPDETFDIVYAANLLHHVDISNTLRESCRVLKKGGVFVSWDPLAHNPVINIYRRIAKDVRTKDEHPLMMKQIKLFSNYFSTVKVETTWLFTLWIFVNFYFIQGVAPNKERYWKKIVIEHKKLEKIYYKLEKLDKIFLKLFPFFKRYCWNIVITATK